MIHTEISVSSPDHPWKLFCAPAELNNWAKFSLRGLTVTPAVNATECLDPKHTFILSTRNHIPEQIKRNVGHYQIRETNAPHAEKEERIATNLKHPKCQKMHMSSTLI